MFDIGTISLILLLAMLLLLAIGMPLGFASAVLAAGVLLMKFGPDFLFGNFGAGPLNILAQRIYGLLTDYVLISIPLFIFMANLLERSGIAGEMYNSLNIWLARTRGGIAIVTSIMAVIMAAMSGIIGGEVVLLGLIALPQMLRLGYSQNLAIGTICASGSLGTMIPPSIVLIIYGLITDTSIKALFTASFLPGFMLASFFIIYIIVTTQLNPEKAPLPEKKPGDPEGREKAALFGTFLLLVASGFASVLFLRALFFTLTGQNAALEGVDSIAFGTPDFVLKFGIALALFLGVLFFIAGRERIRIGWQMGKGLVAPIVVIGVVLGSIYGGITGITEAAGMGVIAVGVIATMRGEMNFHLLWDSLKRTLRATGTIIWVTIGATALAGAYTIAGGPTYIANTIVGAELPTMGIILVMMVIFLFLGAFMDWVGIVLLVMPVFLPIVLRLPVEELGFIGELNPRHVAIWFGVVFCMNMQVSFLSPPFGPAAFYLKSVAPPHITLTDIFKGFLPFIGIQLLALSVLLIWPNMISIFL
ncbi:TRAP transporter large permease [Thalassovita aquimarina]|uniref:TRAP transporter large permease subunit n=1 Tax=Thalassovita aquimarina TaxID=2785917 RepID=A0ABS5HXY3_9RHOB|nr:TRAP transporter large permease subunit [Thalassovita aquimarina]MBR9653338.1 TRAP transporter large permease subunit [Thalassovita aquimarina]